MNYTEPTEDDKLAVYLNQNYPPEHIHVDAICFACAICKNIKVYRNAYSFEENAEYFDHHFVSDEHIKVFKEIGMSKEENFKKLRENLKKLDEEISDVKNAIVTLNEAIATEIRAFRYKAKRGKRQKMTKCNVPECSFESGSLDAVMKHKRLKHGYIKKRTAGPLKDVKKGNN